MKMLKKNYNIVHKMEADKKCRVLRKTEIFGIILINEEKKLRRNAIIRLTPFR
jgi:hypothetical protein